MKKFLKIIAGIIIVLALVHLAFRLTGNGYLTKGLWACYLHGENSATIDDVRYFDTHKIEAGNKPWPWPLSANYNKSKLPAKLEEVLTQTESVAFLVVQNDSILAEQYWQGYSDSSQSNSFSMAKSITTMLAQIAIQKGVLKGWHQKVQSILPEVKGPHAAELELWHLSTMTSGLDWDESYKNPFTVTAKAYYGDHVRELMLTLPIVDAPGKVYNYQSGSTELLGMCLMQASGKSLSELASEWLWKPLQAEHDAKWHTDAQGTELCYCCFNTDVRDFARFGKLMLHKGNWNGTQIIDSSFIEMATSPALAPFYGYSFWLNNTQGTKVFYQNGFLGQYIITIPEYNLVIVRLGRHSMLPDNDSDPGDFHVIVHEVLGMVKGKS
jgi:CubicO group peptidase (beta-lactamase class C family)